MPRNSDFPIHVDSSCLTDSTDLQRRSERNELDQTVVHDDKEDLQSEHGGSHISSQVSHDEHTEALIHAAARAVVASMEQDHYRQEDSVLSMRTEEGYDGGTERTYGDGTEMSYDDDAGQNYESDADHSHHDPYDGSASSHHEDDVFSEGNSRSNRSSMNSCPDEEEDEKHPQEDESVYKDQPEEQLEGRSQISRIPSMASDAYSLLPEPLTITSSPNPRTPSKVMSRPPFRTPSSVRAMQMSSPTASIFSASPRSSKRPTISHLGTPSAQNHSSTKMRTPTRFKAKKENPLVLLHVTVLPLHWSCGDALDSVSGEGLPRELSSVKESWKSLKEKLGDTVLERGILLPHPQDSYEVLEERLLEALELPVQQRAKILTCGHYLGPDDMGYLSEESSENEDNGGSVRATEKWCDICGREVQYEEIGMGDRQKRFRVKVYASNGLMRAGAWAAAWREMERVDVEIEPFLPSHLVPLMDSLLAFHAQPSTPPGFNHEEGEQERGDHGSPKQSHEEAQEAARRKELEDERMREIYGHIPPLPVEADDIVGSRRASPSGHKYGDTLPELIWEAIKVVMRDKKQVAICILSILVVILALRPMSTANPAVAEVPDSRVAVSRSDTGAGLHAKDVVVESAMHMIEIVPIQMADIISVSTAEATRQVSADPLRPTVSADAEPLLAGNQEIIQKIQSEPVPQLTPADEDPKIPEAKVETEAEHEVGIEAGVAIPEAAQADETLQTV